jgi:ferric-dicitrate binding protein FerR (iron transport regulator)
MNKTGSTEREDPVKLAKYLSGEMNESEKRSFEKEIARSDEYRNSMETMKKHWTALEGYKDNRTTDATTAWSRLHTRLQQENLIPEQDNIVARGLIPGFMKIAAALLLLLGTATLLYLFVNRTPEVRMVVVSTATEEGALVKTLADGSMVYIAGNTELSYPESFGTGTRPVKLRGEAFFDVASDPAKPFIIETGDAVIEVIGTAFTVKTGKGEGPGVTVDRGKVKVTLNREPSDGEVVMAGEQVSVVSSKLVKSGYEPGFDAPWYRERMHFKDEPLRNIIYVLNRNFNTNFVLADRELGNHPLTVTFCNETAETMTELLCVTLNLKSKIVDGSVVLSGKKEKSKRE